MQGLGRDWPLAKKGQLAGRLTIMSDPMAYCQRARPGHPITPLER